MAAKDYLLDRSFQLALQRMGVIVVLACFLVRHPENTTAWLAMGGVVTDLFHTSAKANGNGNGH